MYTPVVVVSVVLLALVPATTAQVNGGFGQWSSWTMCSVTCLAGTKTRTRLCDSPAPSGGGANCTGDYSESTSCTIMNYCLPSSGGNMDLNCGVNYFGCATGVTKCVNVTLRCDKTYDCEDGSDENPYFAGCADTYCPGGAGSTETSVVCMALSTIITLVYCMLQN